LHNGFNALTAISAKYNSSTGQIDLAWHGSDASSNGAAIYFMSFNPDTVTSSNTPMPYSRIDAANDQYDPVLDVDNNGWTLVSYLSNQDDPSNIEYSHYGFAVAPWGFIYPPVRLDSATHHYWPGDYSGNFFWSSLDADGARFHLIDAVENPVGSGTLDTRWMGVK
jgi:hypothetical protein